MARPVNAGICSEAPRSPSVCKAVAHNTHPSQTKADEIEKRYSFFLQVPNLCTPGNRKFSEIFFFFFSPELVMVPKTALNEACLQQSLKIIQMEFCVDS